jgi:hypothetical protein
MSDGEDEDEGPPDLIDVESEDEDDTTSSSSSDDPDDYGIGGNRPAEDWTNTRAGTSGLGVATDRDPETAWALWYRLLSFLTRLVVAFRRFGAPVRFDSLFGHGGFQGHGDVDPCSGRADVTMRSVIIFIHAHKTHTHTITGTLGHTAATHRRARWC